MEQVLFYVGTFVAGGIVTFIFQKAINKVFTNKLAKVGVTIVSQAKAIVTPAV